MKHIPEFKDEAEERSFWESHDSSGLVDWSKARPAAFTNLKPSLKTISIRIPEDLLEQYKIQANKLDLPYQSLMKVALSEGIQRQKEKVG